MDGDPELVGGLVGRCIDAATASAESVERWRRQRRTLDRLPSYLADALLRRIIQRRILLYPSWLEIFQNSAEEIDLKGESSVDVEWLAYLGAFRHLRRLNLANCRAVNNSAIWYLSGMNNLKELDLSRCSKITDAGIKHVLAIQNLEKLHVSETGLTSNGVVLLSSLQNLNLLDLGGISITDEALCSLQVLTNLEYLDLWGSKISNRGVPVLEMFPKLSFLNIAWTEVTELPYLPSITCLNMSNCTICSIFYGKGSTSAPLLKLFGLGATFVDADKVFSIIDTSHVTYLDVSSSSICNLHFLVKMDMIEHLDVSFCGITDDSVEYIAKAGKGLKFLNASNSKLTSQGICVLAGNVINLETLYLSNTSVDDVALSYIALMPSLRIVDLSRTKIKGFAYEKSQDNLEKTFPLSLLQNLSHLESLNLEDTLVEDEALLPLVFLKQLRCLYLKSDLLSDVSLHILSSFSSLEYLGFRNAVLSNSGLLLFVPPKALHTLDLRGCWLLTENVFSSFCKLHPQIDLRHELVGTVPIDENVSAGSTSLHKTYLTSVVRSEGYDGCFVDERIKYSMEDLLGLQLSSLSTPALHGLNMLPKELKRTEALAGFGTKLAGPEVRPLSRLVNGVGLPRFFCFHGRCRSGGSSSHSSSPQTSSSDAKILKYPNRLWS
ncbi:receptor like protein 28-like isoform X2 [Musa acuminata AAA Group]|uniref:receptor like protein 28-like isoform X2 n=1 Tax=Musa acuminata AAA Group TaxID=214697 RepID=UPI0031E109DC